MWPFKKKEKIVDDSLPDHEEYRLCFSCGEGHVQSTYFSCSSLDEILGKTQICRDCGKISSAAVCKVTWTYWRGLYGMQSGGITNREFVRYIEDPMKLSEEAIAKIKIYATKKFVGTPTPEQQDVYQQGLRDGTTAFCKWLLGQEEGENA